MALIKQWCSICGHECQRMAGCRVADCATSPEQMHSHCGHEDQHGICTQVGCMPVTEPLGLVNPAVG